MTVRTRLVLAVLSATLIMAVPAVYALSQLDGARDVAVTIRERHAAAGSAVEEMRSALGDLDLAARGYVATGSPAARDRLARALSATAVAAGHLRQTGYGEAVRPSLDLARAIRTAAYQVGTLVAEGNLSEATVAFRGLSSLLFRADPVLAELDAVVRTRSAESARRAERLVSSATGTTTIALLGALLLAFLVGGGIARTVTRPVSLLQSAMARAAEGGLQAPEELEYDRDDELGSLNRAFRFMTEKLEELNRLKAEFLSAASHKLKTPVSVALGYGEMLREGEFGPVNEEQREVLDEVREQMEELTGQIDQLIRLTRAEAGALDLDFRETHVEDLATALRQAFSAAARQKDAEYRVEVDADAPRVIRADEERLRDLVLGNLLDNAFKYIDRGDAVELRIAAAGEAGPADEPPRSGDARWVSLEVRDTGPGIAPEELERIFEPYVRSGEARDALGTGVGLAIARQVVRDHGGRITAESERGEGTRFVVRVPVSGPNGAGPNGAGTHSSGAS